MEGHTSDLIGSLLILLVWVLFSIGTLAEALIVIGLADIYWVLNRRGWRDNG